MKVLLSLPDKLLEDLDKVCAEKSYDRSEYIRMLIRDSLYFDEDTVPGPVGHIALHNKAAKELGIKPNLTPGLVQSKKRILKEQELLQKEAIVASGPTGKVSVMYLGGKKYLMDEFGNEVLAE